MNMKSAAGRYSLRKKKTFCLTSGLLKEIFGIFLDFPIAFIKFFAM